MKKTKQNKTKQHLEYRMVGLVPYNISSIQKGIQYGHAVVEYGLKYFKNEDYQKWAKKDKTFIIYNGGTTNLNPETPGKLNIHLEKLREHKIKCAEFYEPDLGDQLTAIVFLVDERVFNRDKYSLSDNYPGDTDWLDNLSKQEIDKILFLRSFLSDMKFA